MRHATAHPPTPEGATTRELQTIAASHRLATTSADPLAAAAMLDGMAWIVELGARPGQAAELDRSFRAQPGNGMDGVMVDFGNLLGPSLLKTCPGCGGRGRPTRFSLDPLRAVRRCGAGAEQGRPRVAQGARLGNCPLEADDRLGGR